MAEQRLEYRIDRRCGVPAYLQIVQQTEQALRLGLLEPGDKLPTAREVVEATAINPNTVLKAYRELERAGLVEARRGVGTFILATLGDTGAESALRAALDDWARRALAAGVDRAGAATLLTAVLDQHFPADHSPAERSPADRSPANDVPAGFPADEFPAGHVPAAHLPKGEQ